MSHPSGAEHIPVGAFDGVLVAHQQGCHNAGELAVGHPRVHRITQRLPCPLNRVAPAVGQQLGRRIARSGTHIPGGLQALFPEPEFVVEAMRIAVAVRRLQAHRHAPGFTGAQVLRLTLQRKQRRGGIQAFSVGGFPAAKTRIPAEVELRRQNHRLPVQPGALHREPETQAVVAALGHGQHPPRHHDVPAFQRRGQCAALEGRRAQAGQRKPGRQCQQQRRQAARGPSRLGRGGCRRHQAGQQSSSAGDAGIQGGLPQPALLQLQGGARHKAEQDRTQQPGPGRRRG